MKRVLLTLTIALVALSGCATSAPADTPQVAVPDVVGMTGDEAQAALTDAGLTVEWDAGDDFVALASNWTVKAQDPAAGAILDAGSAVTLQVEKTTTDDDSTPVEMTEEKWQDFVVTSWADCLPQLGANGQALFAPGGDGTGQAGTVTIAWTSGLLVFNVGTTNDGTPASVPGDQATTDALASVGC